MRLGLSYDVGIGGASIPVDQRQKIALARALIKDTDILVVNDAISVLDNESQSRIIDKVQQRCRERGLIWVLSQESLAENFTRTLALEKGRVVT